MNLIKIISTLIVLLVTVLISIAKPGLHKPFIIKNDNFKLERYTEADKNKSLVTEEQSNYGTGREVKIEPSAFLTNDMKVVQNNQTDNSEKFVDTETQPDISDEKEKLVNDKQEATTRQLTKREEIIAWNKWRSDLQNDIMLTAKVEAPLGTIFYFSFNVDKFGHISNIKAFSTNPMFKKEVDEKLIPTIKNLEYSSKLHFPKGTYREKTRFKGMFTIWTETSLSTPADFNDIERVNVYE